MKHEPWSKLTNKQKKEVLESNGGYTRSCCVLNHTSILIINQAGRKFLEEENDILKRFTRVFEQTYTRFLDLQKAEAQAKEAQIEAALERVRARTMGMQQSEELSDVATVLFRQLSSLGVQLWSCGFVLTDDEKESEFRMTNPEGEIEPPLYIPNDVDPATRNMYFHWKEGDSYFAEIMEGDALKNHYDILLSLPKSGPVFQEILDTGNQFPLWQQNHAAYFSHGYLIFITTEPFEDQNLFERFAKVFEQTYTRFLDLQKAEAQAREAQIEAALERVRASSMAMHKSEELVEVVRTLDKELNGLGIEINGTQIITDFSNWKEGLNSWYALEGQAYLEKFHVPHTDLPLLSRFVKATQKGLTFYTEKITKSEKDKFFKWIYRYSDFRKLPNDRQEFVYSAPGWVRATVISGNSALIFQRLNLNDFTKEEENIFKRFGKVFEQSYTRFLDLKKAEAQARESEIQLALERVRARTMAMQKSDELAETAAHLYKQLEELGIKPYRINLAIVDSDKSECKLWSTTNDGNVIPFAASLPLTKSVMKKMYEGWKKQENSSQRLVGNKRVEWINYINNYVDFKEYKAENIDINKLKKEPAVFNSLSFKQGFFVIHTTTDLKETDLQIIQRFAKVFEQTYTRFLDLKKAEAQAREAIKQASLDRVRGEIASMRTKDDLNRITPLIWKELNTLGVPFIRCGVFIMNENKRVIQTYLSTPDGNSLTAFEMSFDEEEIASGAVKNWRKNNIYQDFWNKEQFVSFMQNLIKTGQVKNVESFQGSAAPPESLYLNFVPFKQGMLYVGNISELKEEVLQLVQSLADSFSIAYARYEDFRQLEEAKNQIEKTFTELKAAQSQLIQSEKMASLGELTAGIAHEIQNPLNFVNNFSELSNEMIAEIEEERAKNLESRDEKLVTCVLSDIKQNLEKINHHGKRAADIVKGMLLHSRTSNGKKEPTDINALADEYLRLSYHGLRAKDKSFNADFKTGSG